MINLRTILAVGLLGLLAACSSEHLEKASMMEPKGTDFNKALYKEYITLAKKENALDDVWDADAFALKAQMAAQGADVMPDEIAARKLPPNTVGELTGARGKLIAALAYGRASKPADAARAQAMFDCWMEEQEENNSPRDISLCSTEFAVAMVKVGPPPPRAMAPVKFTVLFDHNSATLNAAGNRVIQQAAAAAKQGGPATNVSVVGYSDTSGSPRANFALSNKRAEAVVQALAKAGVPPPRIGQMSVGENDLAVQTADGVREGRNRRVEVMVGN